jgi:hypothetical protein
MRGSRYIINHNPDGRPTIHDRMNLDERCNVDDIAEKHKGEATTARALKMLIRDENYWPCEWCFGDGNDPVPPPAEDPSVTA